MKDWVANITIKIARTSKYEPYKHGAVVESGGRIMAAAVNQVKSQNPYSACSTHAEKSVIRMAKALNVKKCDLYVVRVSRSGIGLSYPCPSCLKAIKSCGMIRKVFYTIDKTSWGTIDIKGEYAYEF